MLVQHTNTTLMVAAVIVYLTMMPPLTAEQDLTKHQSNQELNNIQVVVRNMTEDFRYFGIGPEQAAMLAEQTADFGTSGMLTTMAAVGIVPVLANVMVFTDRSFPKPSKTRKARGERTC